MQLLITEAASSDVGTFHADCHPGNVLLTPDRALALLDFGSLGRLNRHQNASLLSMLIAVDRRDAASLPRRPR